MLGDFPTPWFLLWSVTFFLFLKLQHIRQTNKSTNCVLINKLVVMFSSIWLWSDRHRVFTCTQVTGYSVLSPAYWFFKNNYKTCSLVSIIRVESETWLPWLDLSRKNMISIPLSRIQLLTLMERKIIIIIFKVALFSHFERKSINLIYLYLYSAKSKQRSSKSTLHSRFWSLFNMSIYRTM